MEYTRSIGDSYETFEDTPEEIARLAILLPAELKHCSNEIKNPELLNPLARPKKVKQGEFNAKDLTHNIIISNPDIQAISKKVAEQIGESLRLNPTP